MIYIEVKNGNILEVKGHSDNIACSRVTTVLDLIVKILDLPSFDKLKMTNGYTMIVCKKDKNIMKIFNLFIEYLDELSNIYKNNIKINYVL